MREEILRAVSEIDEARDDIQRFGNLALRRFAHAQHSGTMSDDIWVRALGSYMHDFYTACERLFEIIADSSGEGGMKSSGFSWGFGRPGPAMQVCLH